MRFSAILSLQPVISMLFDNIFVFQRQKNDLNVNY